MIAKDDLISIIVVKNEGYAQNLKVLNRALKLKVKDIKEDEMYASYWFSSEVGIYNMRNSKFKEQHNIAQHLVILSLDEVAQNFFVKF